MLTRFLFLAATAALIPAVNPLAERSTMAGQDKTGRGVRASSPCREAGAAVLLLTTGRGARAPARLSLSVCSGRAGAAVCFCPGAHGHPPASRTLHGRDSVLSRCESGAP